MLRDYQRQAIAETWQHFREGRKSVLLQMATGAGKTRTAVEGCRQLAAAGKRIWWVTHRIELVGQASRAFKDAGVYHGIIAAGTKPSPRHNVQIASIGSLRNRADNLEPPQCFIWDETRHLLAKTWAELHQKYPDARHWGLDATPLGPGGAGLGNFYEVMVRGPSIGSLMDQGYLCRYRLFTPATPDLGAVHHRGGEFAQNELSEIMDKPTIVGSAVEEYRKHAHGKKALLFAVSVEASKHAAQQFCDSGYRFVHVDGETAPEVRARAIRDYENDRIDGICNVSLFTEGTDLRGVRCIIDLAPTESLSRYLQIYGRGLRADDEPCVFLCHSGNFQRHGFVDDEREWPLEGIAKGKKAAEPNNSWECPLCFARVRNFVRICPECQHCKPIESRVIEEVSGSLIEVDLNDRKPVEISPERRAQAMAKSIADLIALGHSEGRAKHIIEAREEKQRLQNQLINAGWRRSEVWKMKPKALREAINGTSVSAHG